MKNILITGYEGFIGNAVLNRLKENTNNFIVGIKRDENVFKKVKQPDVVVKGDIRDYKLISRTIADYEIEDIYHFASQAIVRTCANDPYNTFDINVMGTVSILEACRNVGNTVKNIIIFTSDKVFGDSKVPYTENSSLNPLYIYDTSKACQQLVAKGYYNNYNLPIKTLICSNVYGPGDYNYSRIIPNSIKRLANGDKALLNKHVKYYLREFIYIDDVINALMIVSDKGNNGEVYCIGGSDVIEIHSLLKTICLMMNLIPEDNIKIYNTPSNFKEIVEQYIDSSKLKSLGWKIETNLDEGLKRCIEYYGK